MFIYYKIPKVQTINKIPILYKRLRLEAFNAHVNCMYSERLARRPNVGRTWKNGFVQNDETDTTKDSASGPFTLSIEPQNLTLCLVKI